MSFAKPTYVARLPRASKQTMNYLVPMADRPTATTRSSPPAGVPPQQHEPLRHTSDGDPRPPAPVAGEGVARCQTGFALVNHRSAPCTTSSTDEEVKACLLPRSGAGPERQVTGGYYRRPHLRPHTTALAASTAARDRSGCAAPARAGACIIDTHWCALARSGGGPRPAGPDEADELLKGRVAGESTCGGRSRGPLAGHRRSPYANATTIRADESVPSDSRLSASRRPRPIRCALQNPAQSMVLRAAHASPMRRLLLKVLRYREQACRPASRPHSAFIDPTHAGQLRRPREEASR